MRPFETSCSLEKTWDFLKSDGLQDCPRLLLANYPSWKWQFLLSVLVSTKTPAGYSKNSLLALNGCSHLPLERPHSPAVSVGARLTSSLLPCHTAFLLTFACLGHTASSRGISYLQQAEKRQFHNERGSFAKWGVLEPSHNCASALSQPHTCSCNGSAVICSLPLCMLCPSPRGVSINSLALLRSLTLLSLSAACECPQICPGIAGGPLGWLYQTWLLTWLPCAK